MASTQMISRLGSPPVSTISTPNRSPKRKRGQDSPPFAPDASSYPVLQSDTPSAEATSPSAKVTGKFRRLAIAHDGLGQDGRETATRIEYDQEQNLGFSLRQSLEATEAISNDANQMSTGTQGQMDFTFKHDTEMPTTSIETQARPKSPKPSGEINDLYWQDSEITGHDPIDPDDDGYGINGIGFKPTRAMAQQRTRQRKQQVLEYKNREAREARQKRSERRRTTISDNQPPMSNQSYQHSTLANPTNVRFEDG